MKIIKDKKIFDIRNRNCKIITPIAHIAKMFDNVPVMDNKERVIGLILKSSSFDENCIYGDVAIYKEEINIGDMSNYCFIMSDINKIDKENTEVMVSSIDCICYNLI